MDSSENTVNHTIITLWYEIYKNIGSLCFKPETNITLGEGNGNPLRYSCLENPTDRGAWRATVHAVAKSQT